MCLARVEEPGLCSAFKSAGRLNPAMPAVPAWSKRRRRDRQSSDNQGNRVLIVVQSPRAQCLSKNSLLLNIAQTTSSQALRRSLLRADMRDHARALALRRLASERGQIYFVEDLGIAPARIQALPDPVRCASPAYRAPSRR